MSRRRHDVAVGGAFVSSGFYAGLCGTSRLYLASTGFQTGQEYVARHVFRLVAPVTFIFRETAARPFMEEGGEIFMMQHLSVSYTRKNLAAVMQCVNREEAAIVITSERGKPVVMISLERFNELVNALEASPPSPVDETRFLTRSEKNARRLTESTVRMGLVRKNRNIPEIRTVELV